MSRLQIHRDDFLAIGAELFGEDARAWRFRCPMCKHEQSHNEVKARKPDIGDTSNWIYFSCEGRQNADVGCDWTLGGLFGIHAVEVFDPARGSCRPVFEFAHERAPELVAAAAARFTAPVQLTTEAKTWDEFSWPEWIPEDLRSSIKEFWSWHGGPQEWLGDAKRQGAPVIGSRVELVRLCGREGEREAGRFVHCWNNIGRVVREDGSVGAVSF